MKDGYQIILNNNEIDTIDKGRINDYQLMTDFNALQDLQNKDYVKKYPSVLEGSEIFKWFVQNHMGYDWKNNRIVSMPNKRNGMIYKEYLIPMQLQLGKVDLPNGLLQIIIDK